MTNTNEIRDNVLGYISAIEDVALESEMAVTLSLMEAADKAMMIMENYEGEYIDSFSIFQEATGDGKDPNHPFKEDGLLKTIVMAPINLIKLIIAKLKKLFGKEEMTKKEKAAAAIKKIGAEAGDIITQLCEIAAGHKPALVVGGLTISAAALGIATGKIQAVYGKMKNAFEAYSKLDRSLNNVKNAPLPTIVYKGDETYVSTVFDLKGLTSCCGEVLNALADYKNIMTNQQQTEGTREKDLKKLSSDLKSVYNKFKTSGGYVNKSTSLIPINDVVKQAEKLAEILEVVEKQQATIKTTSTETYSDAQKKLLGQFHNDLEQLAKIITVAAEVTVYHTDMPLAVETDIEETAKKFGFNQTLKDGINAIFDKIKSKKAAANGDNAATTDETSGEQPASDEPAAADTASAEEVNANESAKISIVDEDYIQEGVTRTGKTVKVEETAKTAADVEKLIKKYVSNVAKRGFNNDQKILLVIGDSKIQYDKSGIKKPGKGETWDDVDMSAHDHVDKVKLYVSGPGALAYAKDNNIGKSKQVQEAALPEETVTVESADTSWYN